jgi:dihydroorotate dehydrogenase
MDEHSAQQKFASGAKLVQVYTGFIYAGPGLVKKLINGV